MQSTAISVVALLLQNKLNQKFLIARRGRAQSGSGEWEFPGGKIEINELGHQALQREIFEELGLELESSGLYFLGDVIHSYPAKKIHLHLWKYQFDYEPALQLVDHDQVKWLSLDELRKTQLSQGDMKLIKYII